MSPCRTSGSTLPLVLAASFPNTSVNIITLSAYNSIQPCTRSDATHLRDDHVEVVGYHGSAGRPRVRLPSALQMVCVLRVELDDGAGAVGEAHHPHGDEMGQVEGHCAFRHGFVSVEDQGRSE